MSTKKVVNSELLRNLCQLDDANQAISSESFEVVAHFGPDAPRILNKYCCALEDAFLIKAKMVADLESQLASLQQEKNQILQTLTSPSALADYVSEFFGPNGKCPGGAVITWNFDR